MSTLPNLSIEELIPFKKKLIQLSRKKKLQSHPVTHQFIHQLIDLTESCISLCIDLSIHSDSEPLPPIDELNDRLKRIEPHIEQFNQIEQRIQQLKQSPPTPQQYEQIRQLRNKQHKDVSIAMSQSRAQHVKHQIALINHYTELTNELSPNHLKMLQIVDRW